MSASVSHLRAICYALAGFTCWVLGDLFLKLAGETSLPKYAIMMFGSATGIIVIVLTTWLRGDLKKLRPQKYKGLIALGFVYLANVFCIIVALRYLPLANFYAVVFLAPILITVLAAIFLREHLDWRKGLAAAAGFGGVLVAISPQAAAGVNNLIGYGIAFACVLLFTAQMLLLRFLGRREASECTALFSRIVTFPLTLIIGLVLGFGHLSITGLTYAIASGLTGSIGWLFMAAAYKHAPAATVSPFHYSQIITGALFGYLIWHDVPSWRLIAGGGIIIVSGIYIANHARKTQELLKGQLP